MLKHEDILNGTLILSDWGQERKCLGVIKNVKNSSDTKRLSSNKNELLYDIFFLETGKTEKNVCEGSDVSIGSKVMDLEEAELFLLQNIKENENKIISLRATNIRLKKVFGDIFKKMPPV